MNYEQERELLISIMSKSDKETQAAIVIEEMAELMVVLVKNFFRKQALSESVIEEMGDVEIMLHQLKILLEADEVLANGHSFGSIENRLGIVKEYKLKRLKERVERGILAKKTPRSPAH